MLVVERVEDLCQLEQFFISKKQFRVVSRSFSFKSWVNSYGRFVELSSFENRRSRYIMVLKGASVSGWKDFHFLFLRPDLTVPLLLYGLPRGNQWLPFRGCQRSAVGCQLLGNVLLHATDSRVSFGGGDGIYGWWMSDLWSLGVVERVWCLRRRWQVVHSSRGEGRMGVCATIGGEGGMTSSGEACMQAS